MSPTRRDFLKYTGAAGLVIASSDLVAELIAQSPKGNPLTSQFKGLSDIALGEAKKIGCSYADVRFTRSAGDMAKASAIAKKVDLKLTPVPAYTVYWSSPMTKDPTSVSQDDKQALVQKVVDTAVKTKGVSSVNASVGVVNEWKY